MKRLSSDHFAYKLSPYIQPALTVKPGETIIVESEDGFGGAIKSDADPFPKMDLDRVNQTTGPVLVEGAEPGDTLVLDILNVRVGKTGATTIFPGFGALQQEFPIEYKKVCQVRGSFVYLPGGIRMPVKPVIGTIGVAPADKEVPNLYPGPHGGNMDIKEMTAGTRAYFPVFVTGALFGLGDGKVIMGDGEVNGTGIECALTVKLKVGLQKGRRIERPQLETRDSYMTVASAKTLDEAIKLALKDMIEILKERKGLTGEEAYVLLGAVGDVKIANVVDPEVTVRVAVPKKVLAAPRKKAG